MLFYRLTELWNGFDIGNKPTVIEDRSKSFLDIDHQQRKKKRRVLDHTRTLFVKKLVLQSNYYLG